MGGVGVGVGVVLVKELSLRGSVRGVMLPNFNQHEDYPILMMAGLVDRTLVNG